MARAILKLKAPPNADTSPLTPPKSRRGQRTVIPSRPASAASYGRKVIAFKPPPVSYGELFAFKPQSIGEKIAIVRAWLSLEGFPEIPEEAGISVFATVAGRFLTPRHSWPLFSDDQRREAEAFISEWAAKLLPRVLEHGPAKREYAHASWIVPEISAFYDPALLAGKVA
jgi:hypothetical protein